MGLSLGVLLCFVAVGGGGCQTPSQANIELRKENAKLRSQVEQLELMRKADVGSRSVTTRPTVAGEPNPSVNLDTLYTAHAIAFGRLTGISKTDAGQTLKVYITPSDQKGDDLKAAGRFEVSAFDLTRDKALVGKWSFTPEQAAAAWSGKGLLYCYVLECPVRESVTVDRKLSVRVVFHDALTGRDLEAEKSDARVFP